MKLLLVFGATLLLSFTSSAQESTAAFSKIENRNCEVWNQNPNPNEVISWNGECVNGKTHGKGTLMFTVTKDGKTNTQTLNATYVRGKREGYGEVIFSTGTRIKGEFKNDNINGQGEVFYADGGKFSGTFVNNLQDGLGTLTQANGDKYYGRFKGNLIIGSVQMTRPDGIVLTYETDKDGKQKTAATLTFTNGNKYAGQYTDYKPQGSGTMSYPNGDRFEGAWYDGLQSGLGFYFWKNGDYLTTFWVKGRPNALSELVYKGGKSWIAHYKMGNLVQAGQMYGDTAKTRRISGKGPISFTHNDTRVSYAGIRQAAAGDTAAASPDLTPLTNYYQPLNIGAYSLSTDKAFNALNPLNQAIQADPSKAFGYHLRGKVNFEIGYYADAVDDFEMASKLSGLGEKPFTQELTLAKRKSASKTALRFAIDALPGMFNSLGSKDKYSEALRRLKEAKRLDPTYPELDRYIGEITEHVNFNLALKNFRFPADTCGSAPTIYSKLSNSGIKAFNRQKDVWRSCLRTMNHRDLLAVKKLYTVDLKGTFEITENKHGYKNANPTNECKCWDEAKVFSTQAITRIEQRVALQNRLSEDIDDYNRRYGN